MEEKLNIDRIYHANLLIEQQWFFAVEKAKRVYRKCIKAKKYKLAIKINLKYDLGSETNSDCITAFGLALIGSKGKRIK